MTSNITNTINTINTTNEFKINILEKDGDDTITCYIHKNIKIDVTYLVHTHEYMDSISSLCQKKFNLKPKLTVDVTQFSSLHANNEYKLIKPKINNDHAEYLNIKYLDNITPDSYTEFKIDNISYKLVMSHGCSYNPTTNTDIIDTIYTLYKEDIMILSLIDETSCLQLGDGDTYCYLSDNYIIIENTGDVGSVILFEVKN